jgi:peptidoglycan/LPS O-acetylase OafA/YrhL
MYWRRQPNNNPSRAAAFDARLTSLDLLRFFAALSVVFYHLTYSADGQSPFPTADLITRYGYLA